MASTAIETRPLYSIGTVARLAGVKPDTLRIWERRYGLGASRKSANGRRLYNQTDLEHLQLVARLVDNGFRIGEIAAMERKTLDALVAQEGMPAPRSAGKRRRALFTGPLLCAWLDRHPGCLSQLDALLLRVPLQDLLRNDDSALQNLDMLVLECAALGPRQLETINRLRQRLSAATVAIFYEFANPDSLQGLEAQGIYASALPLQVDSFTSTMKQLHIALDVPRGKLDFGDLAMSQGRIFSDAELARIASQPGHLECGCTGHLTAIIQSLANFEEYSSNCSVDSWDNAAAHACIYAYTSQARWLMEKALSTALEDEITHGSH